MLRAGRGVLESRVLLLLLLLLLLSDEKGGRRSCGQGSGDGRVVAAVVCCRSSRRSRAASSSSSTATASPASTSGPAGVDVVRHGAPRPEAEHRDPLQQQHLLVRAPPGVEEREAQVVDDPIAVPGPVREERRAGGKALDARVVALRGGGGGEGEGGRGSGAALVVLLLRGSVGRSGGVVDAALCAPHARDRRDVLVAVGAKVERVAEEEGRRRRRSCSCSCSCCCPPCCSCSSVFAAAAEEHDLVRGSNGRGQRVGAEAAAALVAVFFGVFFLSFDEEGGRRLRKRRIS